MYIYTLLKRKFLFVFPFGHGREHFYFSLGCAWLVRPEDGKLLITEDTQKIQEPKQREIIPKVLI